MAIFETNGVKLYYEDKGNPNGKETIAFFNGVMASTNSWDFQVPVFEKFDFRIICHDFKGQMKSDKPVPTNEKGIYSFAEHCAEAKALFEHLGVEKVHIVGTSYGGEVAMKFASLYPDMVKTISIIDSVCEIDEVLKAFVLGWKTLCDTKDGEKFFWGMAPSIYGPVFMEDEKEMLTARAKAFASVNPEYFDGQKILYETFAQDVEMKADLAKITCPALVVCGEDDILKKPKFSKTIATLIKNSEYVTIPDCGHVTIFEKPNALNSALLGFILKNC